MPTIYEQLRADIVDRREGPGHAPPRRRSAPRTPPIQRASMDLSKPIDDALVIATLRKGVKNLADAKA